MVLVLTAFAAAGCSRGTTSPAAPQEPDYAVTCVGVLPAVVATSFDESVSVAEKKQLENGLVTLDALLEQHFSGRRDIRFVNHSQVSSLATAPGADALARARVVADKVSCNAVLEITLKRFRERIGGEYTAKEPASVAFDFRLIAVPDGTVLCSGSYDEVQKSVMENLYNFKSATERGFTWVTAEELMREGLEDRLDACRYLAGDK
jgi:hypothetical protein